MTIEIVQNTLKIYLANLFYQALLIYSTTVQRKEK